MSRDLSRDFAFSSGCSGRLGGSLGRPADPPAIPNAGLTVLKIRSPLIHSLAEAAPPRGDAVAPCDAHREMSRDKSRDKSRDLEWKELGQVAQLVEQQTENLRVGGSIPPLATRGTNLRRVYAVGRERMSRDCFAPICFRSDAGGDSDGRTRTLHVRHLRAATRDSVLSLVRLQLNA